MSKQTANVLECASTTLLKSHSSTLFAKPQTLPSAKSCSTGPRDGSLRWEFGRPSLINTLNVILPSLLSSHLICTFPKPPVFLKVGPPRALIGEGLTMMRYWPGWASDNSNDGEMITLSLAFNFRASTTYITRSAPSKHNVFATDCGARGCPTVGDPDEEVAMPTMVVAEVAMGSMGVGVLVATCAMEGGEADMCPAFIGAGATAAAGARPPHDTGAGAAMFAAMTMMVEPGGKPIGTWTAWEEPKGMPHGIGIV
mmetsp:Transcript_6188/g.17679  ORF Transcript_6188/g.17679 Transcript_6188/m.17679 type:complete len:255 (+) Transcript_6188:187-951(+)